MSKCEKCDAHEYLEHSLEDMKKVDVSVSETLMEVRLNLTSLTENLQETNRTNRRLEELLKETRKEIVTAKEETTKHWSAFNIFKTRLYAYGTAAVAGGTVLGWVSDKLLRIFIV